MLPARVLLAEGQPVNRKIAGRMLQKLGCSVRAAADGDEALRMLETESL
jgi:CheY-like chemotaxis protein